MSEGELEEFILNLNRDAMNYLKEENYSLALETLQSADKMLKTIDQASNNKLQAITLNNFGCFYKRINKPNVALRFLKKACQKESIEPVDNTNLAGTLLNICAIYSQLGKHDLALEHGCKALHLVEKCESSSPNLVSTLIIGYHNTGVEYEFLDQMKQAVECYKAAWQCASKQLGENNPLTQSIHKSYNEALEKLEKQELRMTAREQVRVNGRVFSQERPRGNAGSTLVKKLPEIRPYTNNRSISTKGKVHRRVLSVTEDTVDLAQVRFLTGDRMQPMFKNNPVGIVRPKPRTVEHRTRYGGSLGSEIVRNNDMEKSSKDRVLPMPRIHKPQKAPKQKEDYKLESADSFLEEIGEEADNFRTASAPVAIDVGILQKRIKNLENRYEDFGNKVRPMKDKMPDLEGFRVDKIRSEYENQKQKDNGHRKHIELNQGDNEDFEQFISNFNSEPLQGEKNIKSEKDGEVKDELDREIMNIEAILKVTQASRNSMNKSENKKSTEITNKKPIEFEEKIPEQNGDFIEEVHAKEEIKATKEPQGKEALDKQESTHKNEVEDIKKTEDKHEAEYSQATKEPQGKEALDKQESTHKNEVEDIKKTEEKHEAEYSPDALDKDLELSVQAAFRGYTARKYMLSLHLAAIVIQKHVRRHQCKIIYSDIKQAIVYIQAYFRGYLARKHYPVKRHV